MMIKHCFLALLFCIPLVSFAAGDVPRKGIRLDFRQEKLNWKGRPDSWTYRGKFVTPAPRYTLVHDPESGDQVLHIVAEKGSGVLMYDISKIDLNKYPVIRWRWRVHTLPAGADARIREKDDQAVAIYIGTGRLTQKSISYTWQTETPKGSEGVSVYNKVVTTYWYTIRNKTDGCGVWYVEERDLRDDLTKKLGKVPEELALTISVNSQYTGTRASVELDYIEFLEDTKNNSKGVSP